MKMAYLRRPTNTQAVNVAKFEPGSVRHALSCVNETEHNYRIGDGGACGTSRDGYTTDDDVLVLHPLGDVLGHCIVAGGGAPYETWKPCRLRTASACRPICFHSSRDCNKQAVLLPKITVPEKRLFGVLPVACGLLLTGYKDPMGIAELPWPLTRS